MLCVKMVLAATALFVSLQVYYLIYILLHLVSEASFFDTVNADQRVSNFSDQVFRFWYTNYH